MVKFHRFIGTGKPGHMCVHPQTNPVIGKKKTFDVLEWLAAMCSHVPNKGEQMVRYFGYYSNVSRVKRKVQGRDDDIPPFWSQKVYPGSSGKTGLRLIQKIYKIDPLTCPKCSGVRKVISVIENEDVIKKIFNFTQCYYSYSFMRKSKFIISSHHF